MFLRRVEETWMYHAETFIEGQSRRTNSEALFYITVTLFGFNYLFKVEIHYTGLKKKAQQDNFHDRGEA